jgi:hypothetical protein
LAPRSNDEGIEPSRQSKRRLAAEEGAPQMLRRRVTNELVATGVRREFVNALLRLLLDPVAVHLPVSCVSPNTFETG